MKIVNHQFLMLHCQVNIENQSDYYLVTNISEEIAGHHKKDCIRTLFINFLEELTKILIDTLFSMYSATKLLYEVSISVLNKLILSFRHSFTICPHKCICI